MNKFFNFLHVSLKFWVDVAWTLKQRWCEGKPTVEGLARRRTFRVLTRKRGYFFNRTYIWFKSTHSENEKSAQSEKDNQRKKCKNFVNKDDEKGPEVTF